jgi:hypothetical protein
MKSLFLTILCLAFFSCQKTEVNPALSTSTGNALEATTTTAAEDDFSDLKQKKDESCDAKTAEEIVKKEETKAVSLQGGTESDCVVK